MQNANTRRITILGLVSAALMGAILALLGAFATPAYAGGDSGGSSLGGGGCFTPTRWFYARTWAGFEWENRAVCSGTGDATVINNGAGSASSDLAAVGASGCWTNRSSIESVWWLGASSSGAWNRYPGSSNDRSNTTVVNTINGTNISGMDSTQEAKLKEIARSKVFGNDRVIVCVWNSELPSKTVASRPERRDCTGTYEFGSVRIPSVVPTGSRYRTGSGVNLDAGDVREFANADATIVIRQVATGDYTFPDGSVTKTYEFTSPNTCVPGTPAREYGCQSLTAQYPFGYILIPTATATPGTRYTKGDGTSVAKGSRVAFSGQAQTIVIRQYPTAGYRFRDGEEMKQSVFTSQTRDERVAAGCISQNTVTPQSPTTNTCQANQAGAPFGSVTIPTSAGTSYQRSAFLGSQPAASAYTGQSYSAASGTIAFTANGQWIVIRQVAASGSTFSGNAAAPNNATTRYYAFQAPGNAACNAQVVTPDVPTWVDETTTVCNQTYRTGRGSFTVPSANSDKLTWVYIRSNGAVTNVAAGSTTAITSAGSLTVRATARPGYTLYGTSSFSHTWSAETIPTGTCPTVEVQYQWEDRPVTTCYSGQTQSVVTIPTTYSPQAYSWTTELNEGTTQGASGAGGPATAADSASKLSPLGELLNITQNPSNADLAQAIQENASAPHAAIEEVNDNSKTAIAQGGVFNVIERTTNAVVTITDYYDAFTTFNSCTTTHNWYRQQRTVTRTNQTYYNVTYRTVTTTAGTPNQIQARARTRQVGSHCSDNPGGYPGTFGPHPRSGEVGHAPNGNNCTTTTGVTRNAYDWWTAWGGYGSWTNVGSCQAIISADNSTQYECRTVAGTPGSTTYGSWTGPVEYPTCPANTSTYQYSCQGPLTREIVTYGAWGPWIYQYSTTDSPIVNNGGTTYTYTGSQASYYTTQSPATRVWQFLTNHCNAAGFTGATAAGERVDNRDPSFNHSGSAVSPSIYTNASSVPWGNASTNQRGTNSTGFYDKQCAYEGVVQTTNDQYDATFPRDNEFNPMIVDLYRPRTGGVVVDNGNAALATIITRWDGGTPGPNAGGSASGGQLRGVTPDSQSIFSINDSTTLPVPKNFTPTPSGAGLRWAILSGQQTELRFAGTWSTQSKKPNVFNIAWEFNPNVNNSAPVSNVGYGGVGGARSYDLDEVATPVQGRVYGVTAGKQYSNPLFAKLQANTGTGAVNTTDITLVEGTDAVTNGFWDEDPTQYSDYYYSFKFVRAVGQ